MSESDQVTFNDDEEIEIEAVGVEVSEQPIELYKVLKLADAVSGGGEAKFAISEGFVAVNGELDTRKRRKLYDGDLIEFNQEFYLVICDAPVTDPAVKEKEKEKAKALQKADQKAKKRAKQEELKQQAQAAKKPKSVEGLSAKAEPREKPVTPAKEKEIKEQEQPSTGRNSIKFF
ncbi:RNA-binding S4 domain-containing protein [Vibrio palustris]|uniref:Ribosome-associated protein n=1 Tax=Vibrio palustris TaxID=1918946 RepID=A0A1R4B4X5_9VIBR|nr:RNA-binding S4 domain-containing protein [Vibrio palustris]SJL83965.1 ribosome-associated protein [Vibrio palustris]